jgi:hypothetical protein
MATIITKICKVCGNKFKIKSRIKWSKKAKYCSRKCCLNSSAIKKTQFQKGHKKSNLSSNAQWKGGKIIDEKGYIRIRFSPNKWQYEHRIVMEKHLGRKLRKSEQIHHIDSNKINNVISNLILFPNPRAHTNFHLFLKNKSL